MNIVECKTQTAKIVIGLQKGYSKIITSNNELKDAITKVQHEIKNHYGVLLSAKLTNCDIIFLGQEEKSVTLEFIQYPKFLSEEKKWVEAVISFTKKLMAILEQNRTVIVFQDKTIMIENTDEIDPTIDIL